mgnify:FL=1
MENKKEEKIEKIKTLVIILLSIILFVYLVLGINSITHGGKLGFFSLRFYIMSDNSEESNTTTGDLVIAKKTKPNKIKANDNIIFKKDNSMYITNVTESKNNQGESTYFVKATNMTTNENLNDVEILGKVITRIRGIGNIAMFIQSPLGTLNLLFITICIIILIKKIVENNEDETIDSDINSENPLEKAVSNSKKWIKELKIWKLHKKIRVKKLKI